MGSKNLTYLLYAHKYKRTTWYHVFLLFPTLAPLCNSGILVEKVQILASAANKAPKQPQFFLVAQMV